MSQSDLGELNPSITHSTNNVIITLEKVAMYLLTGSLILYNTGGNFTDWFQLSSARRMVNLK